jgi:recombination protein RecT
MTRLSADQRRLNAAQGVLMEQNRKAEAEQMERFKDQRKDMEYLLDTYSPELAKALPKGIAVERLVRSALSAMTRNPDLMSCTHHSIIGSLLTCAELGLLPDSIIGNCYLAPQERRKGTGLFECHFIVGYKGLINLAMRSGQVQTVHAVPVYDKKIVGENGEVFMWERGLEEKLVHKQNGLITDTNLATHFYGMVRLLNGGRLWDVMTRPQVEVVRDASKNYMNAPKKEETAWFTHFLEMAQKTVIRKVLKTAPLSSELTRAIALDELSDAGLKQDNALDFFQELKDTDIITDVEHEIANSGQERQEAAHEIKVAQNATRATTATQATVDKIAKKKTPVKKGANDGK